MNPIPVLGIPHYNRPDLLARCIRSIDYPVENLVLVQQGPESTELCLEPQSTGSTVIFGWSREFSKQVNGRDVFKIGMVDHGFCSAPIGAIHCIRHPNAGVAGAWNEIIKLFPSPRWMIVNNDIEFAPGDLRKMEHFIAGYTSDNRPGIFYGNHGASWFSITADCVEKVGLFDENLHPAYLEDCDYSRRCDLLGMPRANVPDCHAVHGLAPDGRDQSKGSCTVNAAPDLAALNSRTHAGNFAYYERKWGGRNGEEKFKTPFNGMHWPVWAWKFDPDLRKRQHLF